jgi:hypothetical protein
MNKYSPRRQSARWLDEDCPRGVLAIYDHPKELDRYTVFFAEPITGDTYATMWLGYLSITEYGAWYHGEMEAYQAAAYRYRVRNYAAKWSSLPDAVKAAVRQDLAAAQESA